MDLAVECLRDRGIEQKNLHDWFSWEARRESEIAIHDPSVLQQRGVEQVHQPGKTVHMMLQCKAQSSQDLLL